MDSRLSDSTQAVLAHARAEAEHLGADSLGTEHLLLGLLSRPDDGAARLLLDAGATLDGCRSKVVELTGPAAPRPKGSRLDLSDRARRTLERADRLSLRRRAAGVDPEHVLVSLLDVEGRAGQVLRGIGVDVALLRDAAAGAGDDAPRQDRSDRARPREQPGPAEDAPRPSCPGCAADLAGGALAHRVVDSRGPGGDPRPLLLVYCGSCGRAIGAFP